MECCGKICYPTRSQANRAKAFMGNQRHEGWQMRVYRCLLHNGWHLSSRMTTAQNQRFKLSRALDRQDMQFAEAME